MGEVFLIGGREVEKEEVDVESISDKSEDKGEIDSLSDMRGKLSRKN